MAGSVTWVPGVAGGISRASAFVLVAKPWTRVATTWEDWWRVELNSESCTAIGYLSGQDGPNLPAPDCPLCLAREKVFLQIINPLLTKLVRSRWLDIGLVPFFACLWTSTPSRYINTQHRHRLNWDTKDHAMQTPSWRCTTLCTTMKVLSTLHSIWAWLPYGAALRNVRPWS